jgi:hypothetical protein
MPHDLLLVGDVERVQGDIHQGDIAAPPTPGPAEQVNYSSNGNECDEDDHNLANTNTHPIHLPMERSAEPAFGHGVPLRWTTTAV